jgi:hypothetical protein
MRVSNSLSCKSTGTDILRNFLYKLKSAFCACSDLSFLSFKNVPV